MRYTRGRMGGARVRFARWSLAVALAAGLLGASAASSAAAARPVYAVTPITAEAGIDSASFNSLGQIALSVFQGSCCDDAGYWSDGQVKILPLGHFCSTCGGFGGSADGINAAGQIAGSVDYNGNPNYQVFREVASTGAVTLVPTLGGPDAFAHGINGAGQIVGDSETLSGADHAFLWTGSTVRDLGTFGGQDSVAWATAATGQAVGCADTAGGHVHPFRYQGGALLDLHLPAGMTDGCAISVNVSGTILGFAVSSVHPKACDVWLWRAGAFTIVPKLNGQCIITGQAEAGFPIFFSGGHIADGGQVVGAVNSATTGNPVPVVYQNGSDHIITGAQTPFDRESATGLNSAPGWYGAATSNNLHGLISVLGQNDAGSNTLFLLTPIRIVDEDNAAITYSGGWTRVALAGAYGGHVERAGGGGRTATFKFTGKSISLIGVRQPGFGSARVMIDGAPHGTVSEAGPAALRRRLDTIFFAHPGTHTLRLAVQSGPFELDAITVAPH
jgi:probable HAF family extracellular repeat protein